MLILSLCEEIKEKLNNRLLMFYTGIERVSSTVLTEQRKNTHLNLGYLDKMVELAKQLQKMEQQMFTHAKNLEFEAAAAMRNKLTELKQRLLGVEK